jgi:glycosyltransferase involved in cell wall biosynthesis
VADTHDPPGVATEAPKVSVVIPIYNEESILEASVTELVEHLRQTGWTWEILLAENGSRDRTVPLAQELSERLPGVRTFSTDEPNYGKALREGILRARGELVLCEEIDLCDADFHRRAVAILDAGGADLVVGSKRMPGARDDRPAFRRLGTRVINGLLHVALGFEGTDTHGLKAFRREALVPVVEACLVDKDLFASELVIRAQRGSARCIEIPVHVQEKRAPSIGLAKRVPRVLRDLTRLFVAIRIRG